MTADARELLARFDDQLRIESGSTLPRGASLVEDGPLQRIVGLGGRGFVGYRDLGDLDGAALDALIARQIRCFADRGEPFEWKTYGHDDPADLADRLRRAGFVADEPETVMIAPVAGIAAAPQLPAGVTIRTVDRLADLERIAALEETVWGREPNRLAPGLAAELETDPSGLAILVVEAAGEVVCAAWVRFPPATDFATLWGGATHPDWRGRGIYRALVAHRSALAAARGRPYLQVDASADSRPILERLGFVAVTTTTPFLWTPAEA
jgi:GNAT superfamily N-acetyltransferase